jgi:hypothetical protein
MRGGSVFYPEAVELATARNCLYGRQAMRGARSASALRIARGPLALAAAALVLAACGDDDANSATSSANAPRTSTEAARTSEPLVLKTRVEFPKNGDVEGEVIAGSRLGDVELCIGTEFRDRVTGGQELIERTLRCAGGRITFGFTPDTGPGDGTQTGGWEVVDATGRYTGLEGSGELNVVFTEADRMGRETFTGTVLR